MSIIIFLLLSLLLFPSCSPDKTISEREIYLISVADDAYGVSRLKTVITDQAALISQISTLGNVHIYCFTAQEGKRYSSLPTDDNPDKAPTFKPYDSRDPGKGNVLESPADSAFVEFRYIPGDGEKESAWSMNDVLETVENIKAEENDLIIFTYSGHGEDNSGTLITNLKSTNSYDRTTKEELIEAFSSISGKKIFFLDSCFSGNFVTSSLETMDTFSSDETEYTGKDYTDALKKSSLEKKEESYPDLWVMASAGKGQKAKDSYGSSSTLQSHYGAFTYYLLKALGYDMEKNTSSTKSTSLTFYSIYSYITENFPSTVIYTQTPRSSLKRLDIKIR